MLISIGIKDKILFEGFITEPCDNCQNRFQNHVTIWAKSFIFGPYLIPIRWATWDKKAVVNCHNCHRSLEVSQTKKPLKTEILQLMDNYPLWKHNIPLLILGGLFSYNLLGVIFSLLMFFFLRNSPEQTISSTKNMHQDSQPFSQKKEITIPVSDSIQGSWIVTYALLKGIDQQLGESESRTALTIQETEELGLFLFLKNNKFIKINEGRILQGIWSLNGDSLIIKNLVCNGTNFRPITYSIKGIENYRLNFAKFQTMNDIPIRTDFKLSRFRLGNNESKFLEYANKIFSKPQKKETDKEIKDRIKSSLLYYSLCFQISYNNKISGFKPGSIYLPIKFYNGGIGLDKLNERTLWKENYYNPKDAQIAYTYLSKAFKKLSNYPQRGNLAIEYAEVLRQLADNI